MDEALDVFKKATNCEQEDLKFVVKEKSQHLIECENDGHHCEDGPPHCWRWPGGSVSCLLSLVAW